MSSHHSQGWWGNAREKRLAVRKSVRPGRRRGLMDRLRWRFRKRRYFS